MMSCRSLGAGRSRECAVLVLVCEFVADDVGLLDMRGL